MNPYKTPEAGSSSPAVEVEEIRGQRCTKCGSASTTRDSVLRAKPSIVMVVFFGWIFLLIRTAFSCRTDECLDCGATCRYRTVGSWIALAVLLGVVAILAVAIAADH